MGSLMISLTELSRPKLEYQWLDDEQLVAPCDSEFMWPRNLLKDAHSSLPQQFDDDAD
jgi:hypothetical protein